MPNGNNGVRRGSDLKPRVRTSPAGRPRGWTRTPAYNSWVTMRARCNNPNHPRWKDWGGRGITVCERWSSFENFLADMGARPEGTTLERINNDLGYGPGNCCWVTPAEQNRNKRSTVLTRAKLREIDRLRAGMGISQLAEIVGLDRHLVGTVCTVLALQEH